MNGIRIAPALLLAASASLLFTPLFTPLSSPTHASLRGLSVVDPHVVWASGTRGTVLRSLDAGATWKLLPVQGADKLDFRDIKALSANVAYAAAIAAQGGIYKTTDGGATWRLQYHSAAPGFFLDGLAFWNAREGLALGDPMQGSFLILRTSDGGAHWSQVGNLPPALTGEGAFAASGSSLQVAPGGHAWFATGGAAHGRVFRSSDGGRHWAVADTPLGGDGAGSGIFSLAFRDAHHGVAVGGDYTRPQATARTVAVTDDGGKSWRLTADALGGYRSAAAWVPNLPLTLMAVGPTGADISRDGGQHWSAVPAGNLNSLGFAPSGAGFAVGARGAIMKLGLPHS